MDKRLFWRAALIQAAAVAVVAGILIALPLPKHFFKDYGFIAGPLAWIGCAVVTAWLLKLPWSAAAFAAVAGGVAGALVTAGGADHWIGVAVAIAVFGACCASYEAARREMAGSEGGGNVDGGAPAVPAPDPDGPPPTADRVESEPKTKPTSAR
jgi:hypothetical protein